MTCSSRPKGPSGVAATATGRGMVMAAVVVLALLLVASTSTWTGVEAQYLDCPDIDTKVYPYWSMNWNPAQYGESYQLRVTPSLGYEASQLAPEWDETNSTWYVRLAEAGATYVLAVPFGLERPYVSQKEDLHIVNMNTGRVLSWRQEGDDEYFLVEADAGAAPLQLQWNNTVGQACPFLLNVCCAAYSVLSNSSMGLSPYVEDEAVYLKLSTDNLLPFDILRTASTKLATVVDV
ncbi:hypothetical protein GOP47_0010518 [Adiantum capillus-veneris]|uniref:Uncharacterized protein n=1 Tax=Adiantum capillus-veneris TaxID=13818 RepID=A0A9D4ZHV1_ADICA|nr:hypothetical protein GOP47_0010518 [Adiantum capillus-veneris]